MFEIKQLIPSEFCLTCGGCCNFAADDSPWFPRLLKEERDKIPASDFRPVFNKKSRNFLCPCLNTGSKKCKVYKKRPFECRLYPFLINHDAIFEKVFLSLDLNCPFAERNLKNEDFEKYMEYLAAFLKSAHFSDILINNPGFAQSYPGVLNVAELPYDIKKVIRKR